MLRIILKPLIKFFCNHKITRLLDTEVGKEPKLLPSYMRYLYFEIQTNNKLVSYKTYKQYHSQYKVWAHPIISYKFSNKIAL